MNIRPGGLERFAHPPVAVSQSLPWDSLQVALMALVSLQVWRVHELFPVLAVHGLPILITVLAITPLLLRRDPRRLARALHPPGLRTALTLVGSLAPSA